MKMAGKSPTLNLNFTWKTCQVDSAYDSLLGRRLSVHYIDIVNQSQLVLFSWNILYVLHLAGRLAVGCPALTYVLRGMHMELFTLEERTATKTSRNLTEKV